MWAKSVEKPKELGAPVAVEPLLVPEVTAGKMLGVSARTAWELADRGELRVRRIGRRKLYLVSSLKAFAEGGKAVE